MTNGFVNSTFCKICIEMAFYLNRVVIPKRNFISDRNDTVMMDVGTILKESLRTIPLRSRCRVILGHEMA